MRGRNSPVGKATTTPDRSSELYSKRQRPALAPIRYCDLFASLGTESWEKKDHGLSHLEYLEGLGDQFVAGGATLSDDGEEVTGSFLLLDMADRAAAEAFACGDPFANAGLFRSVEVRH